MSQQTVQSPPPETAGIRIDTAFQNQSTLTKASGFMSSYDFTLNPYSGCAFGCQYCYAAAFAPSKKDQPRSPYTRENWGRYVRVKQNAAAQITQAVDKGEVDGKSIYMSSVTDPYQPTERRTGQTRLILEQLSFAYDLKLVVQTRGPLVNNDQDLEYCRQICANGGFVQVNMTITTNDEGVRKACEPTCPSYQQRLAAIAAVQEKVRDVPNFHTCVTMSPLLPTADPAGLAQDLIDAGLDRCILQPTHTAKPKPGRLQAVTRDELTAALAQYWNCPPAHVPMRYHQEYAQAVEIIVPKLQQAGFQIGFGRPGFGPPWQTHWAANWSQAPQSLRQLAPKPARPTAPAIR